MPKAVRGVKRIAPARNQVESAPMPSTFRNSFYAGLLVAFIARDLAGASLERGESGAAAQRAFLHQVERRNWSAVEKFRRAPIITTPGATIARSCSTACGWSAASFFDLTITASDVHTRSSGTARHLAGAHADRRARRSRGEITARVNSLTTPFELPLAAGKLEAVGLEAGRGDERIARASAGDF